MMQTALRNIFMRYQLLILLLFWIWSSATTLVAANPANDEVTLEQLKNLDVADLLALEVNLDEVFDIFDSLVAQQTVNVATGITKTANRAPAVTTVITAQDIEAIGARDIDEVLETIPSLHVVHSQSPYSSQYTMRGIDEDAQILMLINGVPYNSIVTGGRNLFWGGMSVNQIARIEVIRGPGSAVYGADAFAGVINIITKKAEDIDGTQVGTRVGEFNTFDAWVQHGRQWRNLNIALGMEYQTTDGDDRIVKSDMQSERDALDAITLGRSDTSASFAPGKLNTARNNLDLFADIAWQHWQLRLGYQGHYDNAIGLGFDANLLPDATMNEHRYRVDLSYNNPLWGKHWDVTMRASYLEFQTEFSNEHYLLPPGAFLAGGGQQLISLPDGYILEGRFAERQARFEVSASYFGFKRHNMRLGMGYYYADLYEIEEYTNINPLDPLDYRAITDLIDLSDTPYTTLQEANRTNYYAFVQDTWAFIENWEVTAGLRYDHYSDFGHTVNPRFALVWVTTPTLTTKLMYGRAFRAPSFINLYANDHNLSLLAGNPDLDAETIETGELVLDYFATSKLHFAMNIFTYNWLNRIIYTPTNSTTGNNVPENRGTQRGDGIEWEVRWKATNRFSILANYAYVHIDDKYDDVSENRRTAYFRTDWMFAPKWYLNTQIHHIGQYTRRPWDTRDNIDSFNTVNLTVRRKDIRHGHWNIAVGVRNIFDEKLRDPDEAGRNGFVRLPNDIPGAGRQWFGELRYQF